MNLNVYTPMEQTPESDFTCHIRQIEINGNFAEFIEYLEFFRVAVINI